MAAIHGDEPFGLKILAQLRHLGGGRIIRQVGHPEAVAKRKEYLEANLNRCFGPDAPNSKERRIAEYILSDMKANAPDLIIDIHTCECRVGKSAIIAKLNQDLIEVVRRLDMDFLIEGDSEITPHTLFGQNPDKSIVLEFGRGLRTDRLAASVAKKIADLLEDTSEKSLKKIKIYSKTRRILKHEINGQELENYVYSKKLKGYPYLVGRNTYEKYENFVGFIAKKLTRL